MQVPVAFEKRYRPRGWARLFLVNGAGLAEKRRHVFGEALACSSDGDARERLAVHHIGDAA
jgi:hypothetical protein